MVVFAVSGQDWRTGERRLVITRASGREGAKQNARRYLASDPERYTVEPLTNDTDTRVFVDLSFDARRD